MDRYLLLGLAQTWTPRRTQKRRNYVKMFNFQNRSAKSQGILSGQNTGKGWSRFSKAKTKILLSARRISEAQAKIGSPIISLLIEVTRRIAGGKTQKSGMLRNTTIWRRAWGNGNVYIHKDNSHLLCQFWEDIFFLINCLMCGCTICDICPSKLFFPIISSASKIYKIADIM